MTDAGAAPDGAGPAAPRHAWARLLSGPSEEDEIDAVASDAAGNAYLSGKFEQRLTVEGLAAPLISAGRADIMVAKYRPDGSLAWAHRWGGAGEDNVFDAASDAAGNLYLSGYFSGTVDFGGVTLSSSGPGDLDMMVIKTSPDGEVVWAVRAGGAGSDGGNEISLGPDGTVVVLAGSDGSFRAGALQFAAAPPQDALVLTLDPGTGAFRWGAMIGGTAGGTAGGPGGARAKCLGVDGSGNIYVGGDYGGAIAAVGPNRTEALPPARGLDAFLTAWTPGGQLRWSKGWGGDEADLCKGLEATADGDLYVVGYVSPGATFDGQALTVARRDLYVWKLTGAGAPLWLNQISSSQPLLGAEASLAPGGGVLFGFGMEAAVSLGSTAGGPRQVALPAGGTKWPILVGYSPDGVPAAPLLPSLCDDANAGEVSRSGRRLYLDMELFPGACQLGPDLRSSTGSKDALLVAIDL